LTDPLAFQAVARMDDLDPDYPFRIRRDDYDIALFLYDGAVYATDNICTHAYASLADGLIEDDTVECPLHAACFNFRTGKAMTEPATVDLKIYPTRVEADGAILVGFRR
jgi:nitrite reductase/ring-hydroxylating ferredoxin subunit